MYRGGQFGGVAIATDALQNVLRRSRAPYSGLFDVWIQQVDRAGACRFTNSEGFVAVIARSFARIHDSNLKKQGLLALTFEDGADYARIRERDRLDLVDLSRLAPGKPVECRVRHEDGAEERLWLRHSYSAPQLAWFRRGSALNLLNDRKETGVEACSADRRPDEDLEAGA